MRRKLTVMAALAALVFSTMAATTLSGNGYSIGNDDQERTLLDTTWTDWSIVDANNPADVVGTIEEIRYWSGADNPMRFFVVDENLEVTWISAEFDAGTGQQVYVIPDDPVGVGQGDMLGMYFKETGTIHSESTGGTSSFSQGNNSGLPVVGDTLNDDRDVERLYSLVADIVPAPEPTKDACKDGGWEDFTDEPGPFRNQGQCVSYFASDGKSAK